MKIILQIAESCQNELKYPIFSILYLNNNPFGRVIDHTLQLQTVLKIFTFFLQHVSRYAQVSVFDCFKTALIQIQVLPGCGFLL